MSVVSAFSLIKKCPGTEWCLIYSNDNVGGSRKSSDTMSQQRKVTKARQRNIKAKSI